MKKRKRKLVCMYAEPSGTPCEWWGREREPPASMLIGNGGRVSWGDFSIIFDGSDTGATLHIRPWRVDWRGAVGTTAVGEAWFTRRRFRLYRDAVRYAKKRENERLDRLCVYRGPNPIAVTVSTRGRKKLASAMAERTK